MDVYVLTGAVDGLQEDCMANLVKSRALVKISVGDFADEVLSSKAHDRARSLDMLTISLESSLMAAVAKRQ